MTMFGYDRRPELFKEIVYPDPMVGWVWFFAATDGEALGVMRDIFGRGAGSVDRADWLQVAHAAPKLAELWAFETGRLP